MWKWLLAVLFIFIFCIGTGFVTIPFAVSLAGFWPSLIAILLTWGYQLITGFYYLEATIASPPGANIFSIARKYTGSGGAWFSSFIFAIVNYAYVIFFFYLAAPLLAELLFKQGFNLPETAPLLFFFLITGICLYLGVTFSMTVNFFLSLALGFVLYVCFKDGFKAANYTLLANTQWGFLFIVVPALVNTLYFNTIIPTVAPILKYDIKKLKSAFIVAISLASLVLIAWVGLALASAGKSSSQGLNKINPQSISYSTLVQVPDFGKWLPHLFIIMLLSTALGIGTMLIDFFADFFKIPLEERKGGKRFLLSALVLVPPLLLTLVPSRSLYLASLYITEIGPLYLAGLMPIMWVWSLRYYYQEKVPHLVGGGKGMLASIGIVSCFIFYLVGLEIFYQRTF